MISMTIQATPFLTALPFIHYLTRANSARSDTLAKRPRPGAGCSSI
jgi:hypothetical protein